MNEGDLARTAANLGLSGGPSGAEWTSFTEFFAARSLDPDLRGIGQLRCSGSYHIRTIDRGYKVVYREAHVLIEELHEARQLDTLARVRAPLIAAQLLVIDDLFLRRLPAGAGDELADILMSRYEKAATIVTSNRLIDASTTGESCSAMSSLSRRCSIASCTTHHGHLLRFEGKSWRLKEAAERVAKDEATA